LQEVHYHLLPLVAVAVAVEELGAVQVTLAVLVVAEVGALALAELEHLVKETTAELVHLHPLKVLLEEELAQQVLQEAELVLQLVALEQMLTLLGLLLLELVLVDTTLVEVLLEILLATLVLVEQVAEVTLVLVEQPILEAVAVEILLTALTMVVMVVLELLLFVTHVRKLAAK